MLFSKLFSNFKTVGAMKDVSGKSNYFFPILSHISNSLASRSLMDKDNTNPFDV